ncbi:MAG: PDZ domain-containing protein [Flavobacteriales bacterium]|nr:PDZ domain-containing protein [Flavobacteriales bacterium]
MKFKGLLGIFVAALTGGLVAFGVSKKMMSEQETVVVQEQPVEFVSAPKLVSVPGTSLDFTVAASNTVNSVVHIKTNYEVPERRNSWFEMFEMPGQIAQSSGSGVIIKSNGYIVTNNHVIDGASDIEVMLNDNRTYEAKLVGTDPATDLAILKIKASGLTAVPFGNSDNLKIGEWVIAVGNPFSLTSTVTAGIVSAKGRNINLLAVDPERKVFPIESFIQTDAAVNPGNSGGALVNTEGNLIGINTAIASRTGSYSGYSFAVPSSIVKKVANDIMEFGEVQRAFIGVSIQDIDQSIADELGFDQVSGVFVRGLTPGGAAAEVGIETGDVILSVEGDKVNTVAALQEKVNQFRPGDKVNVKVKRSDEVLNYAVTLRNNEGGTQLSDELSSNRIKAEGAWLEALTQREMDALSISNGVKLKKDEDGKFRRAGIREGFIITKIDKNIVEKPKDVDQMLSSKEGGVLIEGMYPNGTKAYYGFGL